LFYFLSYVVSKIKVKVNAGFLYSAIYTKPD